MPSLSVVVPVHQGERTLPLALAALERSRLPRTEWELIVVDDGSTDASGAIAARSADRLIRLSGGPRGPAFARNVGAGAARGDVVVFADADVCVHPDALPRLRTLFRADPGLAAAFGSYDDAPPAPGLVSRFRNLLHHHVHQRGAGEADTFWAGCGAVRREALREAGGFDAGRFPTAEIEDVELGHRLRRRGRRILLDPRVRCSHLKRWTLGEMVRTDFLRRGIPWTRLLLERRGAPSRSLNLGGRERVSAALALAALGLSAAAPLRPSLLAGAAAAAGGLLFAQRDFYRLLARREGAAGVLAGVPLHLLYYATATAALGAGVAAHLLGRVARPAPAAGPPLVPERSAE